MNHSTCTIERCSEVVFARGWCGTHYHRWRKTGSPLSKLRGYVSVDDLPQDRRFIDRFPGYVFCADGSIWTSWQPAGMGHGMKIGCQWKRLKHGTIKGYLVARLSHGDATIEGIQVHVAIAEAFWGPKPDPAMDCCHNDGNRKNCAISNLRYDTKKANCADKHKHGTMYGGERHHDAKLTAANVIEMRALHGKEPVTSMAKRYGISTRAAFAAIRRETWKHI